MKAVALCFTVVTLLGFHIFPVDGINQDGIPMDQRIPAIFRSSRQTIGGTMNYDLSFEKMVNLMKGFMKPKPGQGGGGAAKQPASVTEAPARKTSETEKPAAKATKESVEESSSREDDAGKARAAKPAPEAEPSKGEAVASEAVESGSEEKRGNGLPPMNGGKSSEKDEE
ncbi:uncharacterized protein LOC115267816 [Aedes albopictus]|uniref:Secreted protein n=1 Tax=Aedes albopictus TaxID=7160 RepID=A0ABM1Z8V8_AEDAL|nr:uncharacterized protein LOC115267816 [Aedes albopictus]